MMDIKVNPSHQIILDTFIRACEADERIIAAFLVGSYVKGQPDSHSDLDLYLVTTNEAYTDFASRRESFVRLLGEPLFTEDFDIPGIVFLIFSDGSEVEISYAKESQVGRIFNEPFKVLLDKKNIAANIVLHKREVNMDEQQEKLRRLIQWFWHDFSHFVTALGRDQLWWALGQLEVLRSMCVGLARLRNDFSDTDVEGEVYFKIEKAISVDKLSLLQDTFPPMEKDSILKAGLKLVHFYIEHATSLAKEHGIAYPNRLEKIMLDRLKEIS